MRKLAFLLAIVLLAGALWFYESPRLAARDLREAVEGGEADELRELVDLEALRTSLEGEMRELASRPAGPPPPLEGDDALLDPAGLSQLAAATEGDSMLGDLLGAATSAAASAAAAVDWRIERESLNAFRVHRTRGDGRALADLLFRRDGLGWKLSGIDVR